MTAKRLGAIPFPAILSLKDGGFAVLGAGSTKGMARLVDPIARTAQELSLEDIAALSSGELILITRRFGGAGVDPTTFGFRWFWPSILRYRRSLAHVLVASLFVQLFALATPIFFQLVVDKVLVHKGVSTLIVLVIGMVTLGFTYTNNAGEAKTGTVSIPYRATADDHVIATANPLSVTAVTGSSHHIPRLTPSAISVDTAAPMK